MTKQTVAARWNEVALEAVRLGDAKPTEITRALHIAHAAMYDAWAAYDDDAVGAYTDMTAIGVGNHVSHSTAISYAAHATLVEVFPHARFLFDTLLNELAARAERMGEPIPEEAREIGLAAAEGVLAARANDGSNAENDFADTSGYEPVNPDSGEPIVDPNHWTPLRVPNGTVRDENGIPVATDNPATYDLQKPLTPHWGDVTPFAIEDGDAYRPEAPPELGDFSEYVDQNGKVTTGDAAYREQFGAVLEISAGLTAEQKATAEYWADGPRSSTPPGHWNEIAQDVSLREGHDLGQDVKFFFALNNALFDTGIAVWDAKYEYDYVRPQTAIRHLFDGQQVEAWIGPNQGAGLIDGGDWIPYQDVTFVTPPFPEYGSGHSGFSYAAATIIDAFTGTPLLYDGVSRGAQDLDGDGQRDLIGSFTARELTFEDYDGPPIELRWDTVWDAAADAGLSRLYGGIHIQDGDLSAREIGAEVAADVWAATSRLFTQDADEEIRPEASTGTLDLGEGDDVLVGALDALDGLRVSRFSDNDAIRIEGLSLTDETLGVRSGSAILEIDADGDGFIDGTITLEGDFDGQAFRSMTANGQTILTLASGSDVFLSDASERFFTQDGAANVISTGGGDDDVRAGDGDDVVDGDAGDDVLRGEGGNDTLIGGTGDDTLSGGAGRDVFAITAGSTNDRDVIADYVRGEDRIELAGFGRLTGRDIQVSREGGDLVVTFATGQSVRLNGVSSLSDISLADVDLPSEGRNVDFSGVNAQQRLTGADDVLASQGDFDDAIFGQGGNDLIETGAGDDTITGGAGSDTMDGGAGADLFRITGRDLGTGTVDVIRNFESRIDKVQFIGIPGVANLGDLRLTRVEGDLAVDLGDGNLLRLEGITRLSQLNAADAIIGGNDPELTVGLSNDTGASDSDAITRDAGLSGTVADDVGIDTFEVRAVGGRFIDITNLVRPDGSFAIPSSAVRGALGEGTHSIEFRVTDQEGKSTLSLLEFTIDTQGPGIDGNVADGLSEDLDSLTLTLTEPLGGGAPDPSAFDLRDSSGARIEVTSVDLRGGSEIELNLATDLEDGAFTLSSTLTDAAGNTSDIDSAFTVAAATRVLAIRPTDGTERANLDGKITIEFNRPVDPDTISPESVQITALGETLAGRFSLSSDGTLLTFFADDLLPAATSVRVVVDGSQVRAADGGPVSTTDEGTSTFDTASLTRVPDTNIEGFIFDANFRDEDGLDIPLEGVVVSVIGLPGVTAVTDANGRFFLEDLPIPQVYLEFDASNVTNRPDFDYGTIDKPVDTVAGQTVGLSSGDKAFNIYFAALAQADVTELVPGEETEAGIGENGLANLTEIFPGIDPELWNQLKVRIPADSLTRDDGTPVEEVQVMAFEPDRIPAPLPPGFDPTVVFTVRAGDATNVDGNAQIEFPNIDNLDLGERRPILSFDHDAGEWIQTGTAIVVDDGNGGTILVSEGDSGVNTLGWKAVGDEDDNCGGAGDAPMNPPPPDPSDVTSETFSFITYDMIEGDGEGFLGFFTGDPFEKIEFSAPDEIDGPRPNEDGCEDGNEDPEDERYVRITIDVDDSVRQFMSSTGNLNLSGGSHSFILRPGDSKTYTLDFDPKTWSEMIPGGFKTLNENQLYSGDIVVRREEKKADGSVTIEEERHFLSRFIDATDDDHDDATISFPRTIGDGAGNKMRELPVNFISGSSGDPLVKLTGTNKDDFKVTPATDKVVFDPLTGAKGDPRTSKAAFDIFNPADTTAKAGDVGLAGLARNVQEIEISLSEFTTAVTSFLASPNGHYTTAGLSTAQRNQVATLFNSSNIESTYNTFIAATNKFYQDAKLPLEIVKSANDTKFINTNWLNNDGNITDNFLTFGVAKGSLRSNDIDVAEIWKLFTSSGQTYADFESFYRLDALTNQVYSGVVELYLSELLGFAAEIGFNLRSTQIPGGNLGNAMTAMFAYTLAHEAGHHLGLAHAFDNSSNPITSNSRNDIMSYLSVFNSFPPSFVATKGLATFSLYSDHTRLDFLDALVYTFASARAGNFIGQSNGANIALGQVIDPDTGEIINDGPPAPDGAEGYEFSPEQAQVVLFFGPDGAPLAGGFDFGEVTVEAGAVTVDLEILSFGAQEIVALNKDGSVSGSPFSVQNAVFDPPLAFGDTASLSVSFDAVTPGAVTEEVRFVTGDGTEASVVLRGSAVSLAPNLQLSSANANFGAADAAGETVTQTFTLSNEGRETLVLSAILSTTPEFVVSGLPSNLNGLELQQGESLSFDVTFDPVDAGLVTGNLEIQSNTGQFGIDKVVLNGTGTDAMSADWGSDYVLVEIGSVEFRALSDATGDFEFRLPTEAEYAIRIFDPVSGLIAEGFGTTAPSGFSTDLTSSLVFRATTGPDSDGDGLTDEVEKIIGSRVNDTDTNDDGISDFRAVELGFDPQEGVGFPTGIIGAVPLRGEALDVTLTGGIGGAGGQTAYLATGSHGLAIVDASQFQNPILQAELDLAGTAKQVAVDAGRGLAYVAADTGGLHIVDVSDPLAPVLQTTTAITGGAKSVVDLGGTLLVGGGTSLSLLNAATGARIANIDSGGLVNDLAVDGDTVYAIVNNTELVSYQISGAAVVELARVTFPQSTIRTIPDDKTVFINEGVAYIANGLEVSNVPLFRLEERGGYLTYDVSDPLNISLISNIDTPRVQAGNLETIVNGSGLALVAGGFRGLQVHNASDPDLTYDLLAEFATPGTAKGVALASGIAYVADGTGGLQVINVLPFDANGQAPEITINAEASDADPNTAGIQIEEGVRINLSVEVADDVQVRNVELLLNGAVALNDVSAPFGLSFDVPTLDSLADDQLEIQVRATDTGGNFTITDPITVQVIEDITPPTVLSATPSDGRLLLRGNEVFTVAFSERIDPDSIALDDFKLTRQSDGAEITPVGLVFLSGGQTAQISFAPLDLGAYEIAADLADATDLAGNALGMDLPSQTFEIVDATAIWNNPAGGAWETASNWRGETLPVPGDGVAIVLDEGAEVTVSTFGDGIEVDKIRLDGVLRLQNGTLQADILEGTAGRFVHQGGTLLNTTLIGTSEFEISAGEPGAFGFGIWRGVQLGANASIENGTLTVENGLTLDDATLTLKDASSTGGYSYSAGRLNLRDGAGITGTGTIRLESDNATVRAIGFYGTTNPQTTILGDGIDLIGHGYVGSNTSSGLMQILGQVTAEGGRLRLAGIDQAGQQLLLNSVGDGVVGLDSNIQNAQLVVATGANVELRGGTDLQAVGPGVLVLTQGSVTNFDVAQGATARVEDRDGFGTTVTANGTLNVDGRLEIAGVADTTTQLTLQNVSQITGTGTVALGADTDADEARLTVRGVGYYSYVRRDNFTFGEELTLSGAGLVSGRYNGETIRILGTVQGVAGAGGATLDLDRIDQRGGTLTIDSTAGAVRLDTSFENATLMGMGTVDLLSGLYMRDVTIASTAQIGRTEAFARVYAAGDINIDGGLDIDAGATGYARLFARGTQDIGGTGRITLSGEAGTAALSISSTGEIRETVTFGADLTIAGNGIVSAVSAEDSVRILGTVEGVAGESLRLSDIDNAGATLRVDASSGVVAIQGEVQNTVFAAAPNATGSLSLLNTAVLNAVTLDMDTRFEGASTSQRVTVTGGLTVNEALTLEAGASQTVSLRAEGSQTFGGTGKILLTNGTAPEGAFQRSEILLVNRQSVVETLTIGADLTVEGTGSVRVSTSTDQIAVDGILRADNGLLTLDGLVAGVEGELAASDDGTLSIQDDLILTERATLGFGLSGSGVGQISVTSDVQLAGTLALDLGPGFNAMLGDEITLLDANGTITGAFDAFTGFDLAGNLAFELLTPGNDMLTLRVTDDATARAGGFIDAAPFVPDPRADDPRPELRTDLLEGDIVFARLVGAETAGQLPRIANGADLVDLVFATDVQGWDGFGSDIINIHDRLELVEGATLFFAGQDAGRITVNLQDGADLAGMGTLDFALSPLGSTQSRLAFDGLLSAPETFELGAGLTVTGSVEIDTTRSEDRVRILADLVGRDGETLTVRRLDNGDETLNIDARAGIVEFAEVLENVRLDGQGTVLFRTGLDFAGSTLAMDATVIGDGYSGLTHVFDGLTLEDDVNLLIESRSRDAELRFEGEQSVDGMGTIRLSKINSETAELVLQGRVNTAETLTFGEGIDLIGAGEIRANSRDDAIRILGGVSAQGGDLSIRRVDNDGADLEILGSDGRVVFGQSLNDARLVGTENAAVWLDDNLTLRNVTLARDAVVADTDDATATVTVDGGLVLENSTLNVIAPDGGRAILTLRGGQEVSGTGVLRLGHADPFNVNSAAGLQLQSSSSATETFILAQGITLQGSGVVNSNFRTNLEIRGDVIADDGQLTLRGETILNGNIRVEDDGQLYREQSLNLESDGVLTMALAGAGIEARAGLVGVRGDLSLGGTFAFDLKPDFDAALGTQFVLLNASGALSGRFTSVTGADFGDGSKGLALVTQGNSIYAVVVDSSLSGQQLAVEDLPGGAPPILANTLTSQVIDSAFAGADLALTSSYATWEDVTLNSAVTVTNTRGYSYSSLRINGDLTVNGQLTLDGWNSGVGRGGSSYLNVSGGATIDGSGEIILSGNTALAQYSSYGYTAARAGIRLVSQTSASDTVVLGADLDVIGNGVITANSSTDRFQILGDVTAAGGRLTLSQINQGGQTLSLASTANGLLVLRSAIENGTLSLAQGSRAELQSATVTDVTLAGDGDFRIDNVRATNLTIEGTAQLETNRFLEAQGGLEVDGTLTVNQGGRSTTSVQFRGTQTVDGTGEIRLFEAGDFGGTSRLVLLNTTSTGTESLTFGKDVTITGTGLVSADGSTDHVRILGSVVGDDANGADGNGRGLRLSRIDQDDGALSLDTRAGDITFETRLDNAQLTGQGQVKFANGLNISNVTLDIDAEVQTGTTVLEGGIEVNGTLSLTTFGSGAANVSLRGTQTVSGTGVIDLSAGDTPADAALSNRNADASSRPFLPENQLVGTSQITEAEIFVFGEDITITGAGRAFTNSNTDSLRILGTLMGSTDGVLRVEDIDNAGAAVTIDASLGEVRIGDVDNTILSAAAGQTGEITFYSGADLTDVELGIDARLGAGTASRSVDISGDLTLNADLVLADDSSSVSLNFRDGASVSGTGRILLQSDAVPPEQLPNGTLNFFGASSEVETFVLGSGIELTGAGTLNVSSSTDLLDVQGQVIADQGELNLEQLAAVGGTLGTTADGFMDLNDELILTDTARVEIGVGASGAGVIDVRNGVTLDGTLSLDVGDGFVATLGDEFEFLRSGETITGAFDSFEGFDLAGDLAFELVTTANALSLRVTTDGDALAFI